MDTIIKLLKQNARLSNKELAAMTGASEAEIEAIIYYPGWRHNRHLEITDILAAIHPHKYTHYEQGNKWNS